MGTKTAVIHATACVEATAQIGDGTVIWNFSYIGRGAQLGNDCTVGQGVYVDREVRIGHRVWIHNKASIYRPVEIGDDVFVGPHVVFVNDPDPTAHHTREFSDRVWRVEEGATIGANATIMNDVNLAHHCLIGAGAVVTRDTVPYGIYIGVPARLHGYRCACCQRYPLAPGLPASCDACQRIF